MAYYIVKRRSIQRARPNIFGMKVRRGRWQSLSSYPTAEEAISEARKVQGLYEVAVFHEGKRVTDSYLRLATA